MQFLWQHVRLLRRSRLKPPPLQRPLVEGKVPGPEEVTISVYSINDEGTGLIQNMDALEELTEQGLVDKLIEYGTLDEGTTIISLDKADTSAVVNLSAIPDYDGDPFYTKATS